MASNFKQISVFLVTIFIWINLSASFPYTGGNGRLVVGLMFNQLHLLLNVSIGTAKPYEVTEMSQTLKTQSWSKGRFQTKWGNK